MNYRLQISPSLKETQKQILSMMFDSGWKQSDSNSDRQFDGVSDPDTLRNSIIPSFFGTYFSILYGKIPSKVDSNNLSSTKNGKGK